MKNTLTLLITVVACATSHGLTLSPSVSLIDAGVTRFDYYHPYAGKLDGVITPDNGAAYGFGVSKELGKWTAGVEAQYLDIGLKSVTVGGQLKNWGDSAQGYYVGAKVSRKLIGGLSAIAGVGYQDLLGGALAYSYGLEYNKNAVSLSLEQRHTTAREYEGYTMRSEPSTLVSLAIRKAF